MTTHLTNNLCILITIWGRGKGKKVAYYVNDTSTTGRNTDWQLQLIAKLTIGREYHSHTATTIPATVLPSHSPLLPTFLHPPVIWSHLLSKPKFDANTYGFLVSLFLRSDMDNMDKHKASPQCVYGCVFWGSPSVYKYRGNEGMQRASLLCGCAHVYLSLLRQL